MSLPLSLMRTTLPIYQYANLPTFQPTNLPTVPCPAYLPSCLPAYLPTDLPADPSMPTCRPILATHRKRPVPFPLMQSINLSAYRPADLLPLAYRPSAHPPPSRPTRCRFSMPLATIDLPFSCLPFPVCSYHILRLPPYRPTILPACLPICLLSRPP